MSKIRLILLIGFGCCCTGSLGTDRQDQNALEVAFAFSDVTGTRLLSVGTPADPGALSKGIFPGGRVVNAKFQSRQQQAPEWNGRQIARNFDSSPGSVFQIQGSGAISKEVPHIGEACLLMTEPFLRERKLLNVRAAPSAKISPDLLRRVERAKGKKAAWGNSIARLGSTRELILVQFVPEGKSCLASLVLVAPDSLSFDDHMASYDERVKDYVWRVDTPGPGSFHVLAAFDAKEGIEIAILWDGFEGQNLYLLRPEGAILRPIFRSYRYWAPI